MSSSDRSFTPSASANIKFLAGIINQPAAKRATLRVMKRKIGQRASALRLAPDVKGLYAEARILRDTVLQRIVDAGFEIDEALLPEAQAIVSSHIGALVAAPEFEIILRDYSSREARIVTLLVHACAGEIAARAEERRKAGRPLRLVPPTR